MDFMSYFHTFIILHLHLSYKKELLLHRLKLFCSSIKNSQESRMLNEADMAHTSHTCPVKFTTKKDQPFSASPLYPAQSQFIALKETVPFSLMLLFARWFLCSYVSMSWCRFQPHDPNEQQCHTEDPRRCDRLFEHHDSNDHGAQSSYSCPDCICCTKGQVFGRLWKEQKAENHSHDCQYRILQISESFRKFHACGPDYLKPSCNDKIYPFHICILLFWYLTGPDAKEKRWPCIF